MNIDVILRLLKNSGFHVFGVDNTFIYIEDPSCILRSFQTFIEYAWVVIVCITGLLLFGWALGMIRGAKNDIFINIRNLMLIFGILGAAGLIVNFIWGGDLMARGCRTISVPIAEINKILDKRNAKLTERNPNDLYEEFSITDTGPSFTSPEEPAPDDIEPVHIAAETETISSKSAPDTPSSSAISAPGPAGAPIRAAAADKDVIYTHDNGLQVKRTGGSRAWKNMNPGNLRYTEFTRKMGAIGQAGGFAVFPDEQTGVRAIRELLRGKTYSPLSVRAAIHRYAPPFENDTNAYNRQIQQSTGLDIERPISDLSDTELNRVISVIRRLEGWTAGQIIEL